MRSRRLIPLLILLVFIIGLVWLIRGRRGETTAAANPIVLCPGPDAYGYTCESGAGYAYIDATNDTFLYQDDGVITLELPFPFTFYGTTYEEITASSNGNLQFSTENTDYLNACVTLPEPVEETETDDEAAAADEPTNTGLVVAEMGDLIAPYWTDLDLRFYGYLETEVVGEEPNRIFVIEWDSIPPFDGEPEDGVTFAVQLFEGSNNIVVLYQDVTSLTSNGLVSTVLLQSESQGLALQYSCNQPTIADLSAITFPHPSETTDEWGIEPEGDEAEDGEANEAVALKADAAALLHSLNLSSHPETRLAELQAQWANQNPVRLSQWLWADLTGDGLDELILLWRTKPQLEQSRLLILSQLSSGSFTLLNDVTLSNRTTQFEQLTLAELADVTADGTPDVILHDAATGQTTVLLLNGVQVTTYTLDEKCTGRVGVVEGNVVRDGCGRGRVITGWNGSAFRPMNR
ncbi:MAG: hypothetical protein IPL78_08955 [Chloroflexi bacterium]|nr:hypothetical protein [Chloroflexota bacterium]